MDITNPRHAWAAVIGGLALLAVIIAVFMQAAESDPAPKRAGSLPPAADSWPAAVQRVVLPSGVERAMTQNIPLIGPVTGARWISGHRFQVREEAKIEKRLHDIDRNTAPPMDVLVDADGYFIMARLNGERFATRPHTDSLKKLLGNIRRRQGNSPFETDQPTEVTKIDFPKIAWDDPALGQEITGKYFQGYLNAPTPRKTNREESYTLVDIWLDGEAGSRRILLARFTDGLTYERAGDRDETGILQDYGDAISGTNRYGALVVTRVGILNREPGLQAPSMYLMEPWEGPCPWAPERLDADYGDNRLDEFMLPPEFNGYPQTIFDSGNMKSRFWAMERMSEAAAKRKEARLAAEAAAAASGPK